MSEYHQPVQRHASVLLTVVVMGLSALPAYSSPGSEDTPAKGAHGGTIIAVEEQGRKVYVNDGSAQSQAAPRLRTVPQRNLVYWSNTERRWKRVPAPSPAAMIAARDAAAEVRGYVVAQPRTSGASGDLGDPNYAAIARGHQVSAADIDSAIDQSASRHGVDPNLVRALIKVESNFNPNAVSHSGAMGLMQLMPGTANGLRVNNPFDPQQNVDAGVRHLRHLLDNYNGDLRLSLAAYNAGERAVARSRGIPRYRETQNYVKRITDLYWNQGGKFGSISGAPVHVYRGTNGVLHMSNTE